MINKIREFSAYLASRGRSKGTIEKYKTAVETFDGFLKMHGWEWWTCPETAMDDFVTWLRTPSTAGTRASSANTVSLYYHGIRAFLKWLRPRLRQKGKTIPAFENVDLPKIRRRLLYALSNDELISFIEFTGELREPYRTLLMIMPFCGLRLSEVISIRIGDIQEYRREGSHDEEDCRYVFRTVGKGNKERLVPMFVGPNGLVSRSFYKYLHHVRPGLLRRKDGKQADYTTQRKRRWLFPSMAPRRPHNHVDDLIVQRTIASWARSIVVNDRITAHKMRVTYLTAMLSVGVDMPTACRYAGHQSINTLADHYAGLTMENAADLFGDFYRPTDREFRALEAERERAAERELDQRPTN